MTIASSRIVGLVLAGGLSRRMFAAPTPTAPASASPTSTGAGAQGDKGLLDLGGRSMLARVVARLAPQVACVVLNANGDPSRFAALGLPVVADTIDGFPGPLAGILAGLRWTAAHRPDATHVASVSSDAPFVPTDLVARLACALTAGGDGIALARSGGELHPVIGLWPVAHADDLERQLRAGVRKVLRFTDAHGTVPVDFAPLSIGGREVDPFFNANTPEELEEARHLAAGEGT